jgi:hypothetical protein
LQQSLPFEPQHSRQEGKKKNHPTEASVVVALELCVGTRLYGVPVGWLPRHFSGVTGIVLLWRPSLLTSSILSCMKFNPPAVIVMRLGSVLFLLEFYGGFLSYYIMPLMTFLIIFLFLHAAISPNDSCFTKHIISFFFVLRRIKSLLCLSIG